MISCVLVNNLLLIYRF